MGISMIGWLIYGKEAAKKNQTYIQSYFEEGKKKGIEFRLLLQEDLTLGVDENGCYVEASGNRLTVPDFAIVRTIYPLLSSHLEMMGMPVFNNSNVSLVCNDKARTYQYLSTHGIACVPTVFCRREELEARIVESDEQVVKSVDGHGGSQVFLSSEEAVMEKTGNADVVIQPLISGGGKDIRVYIIGNDIIGAVCRQAKDGFKANFSLGGEVSIYDMKPKETDIVKQICQLFDFGMVGVDFIIDADGNWLFNEIEDVVGARMLYQCSDINLVRRYLSYIVSKL